MARPKKAPPPAPRRRRTAEEARAAIMDAAERQLVAAGPGGIRLQDVAREVGVSHPTVLHHFGSREGLVDAVVSRALDALHADVTAALADASAGEDKVAALLDGVAAALSARGQGRAMMWLALGSPEPQRDDLRLREQAEAVDALRRARFGATGEATLEDSQFMVVLAASTMLAHSVMGAHLLHGAGVRGAKAPARFRAWLARLLVAHVERCGGATGQGA
ncbi:MAG: TetR/AcrR family transcriptional regulator [Polyangiales bacterium]